MTRKIWALADLHLSLSAPEKDMAFFGPIWEGYMDKISARWRAVVGPEDLVLLAGDICWATRLEDAKMDLEWIDALPGTKVMIKGNHDYWWHSLKKIATVLPPSIHLIQNNHYDWEEVTIGGSRLWDAPELNFSSYIEMLPNPRENLLLAGEKNVEADEKVYQRELGRLETSLRQLNPKARLRIAMTHYPPIGANLESTAVSKLLEKYRIDICVFGHLHSLKGGVPLFGEKNGVQYFFTACDYLDFHPLLIRTL